MTTHAPDPVREAMLDRRLAEVRRELVAHAPPAALEGALAAQFRRTHRPGARPRLWWMPPLALAATLVMVSWMVRVPPPTEPHAPIASANPAQAEDPGPFLALKPLDRIAAEPSTTVVETEFPRALLADWGLPVSPDRAGEPVRAQMLYAGNGEPLAVRILD